MVMQTWLNKIIENKELLKVFMEWSKERVTKLKFAPE